MILLVLFAGNRPSHRRITWRILRRRPRYTARRVSMWLTSVLTRSPLIHCSISDLEIVLDISFSGDLFYPYLGYIYHHPTLIDGFLVPGECVNVDTYGGDGPADKRIWPTLAKLLTNGLIRTRDCSCIIRQILIDAGHPVPNTVLSPADLHQWLADQGYRHVRFREDPGQHRRVHSATR